MPILQQYSEIFLELYEEAKAQYPEYVETCEEEGVTPDTEEVHTGKLLSYLFDSIKEEARGIRENIEADE